MPYVSWKKKREKYLSPHTPKNMNGTKDEHLVLALTKVLESPRYPHDLKKSCIRLQARVLLSTENILRLKPITL